MEVRKETLGVELSQRGKANQFIDQRFGEANESLSKEERMLMRFQKERQRGLKKTSKFNIDEDEGEEAVLTHHGTALSEINLRDDYKESDPEDDEDRGNIGEEQVALTHFGGFMKKNAPTADGDEGDEEGEAGEGRKSKKDIMSELIAKSKYYKMERQKVREENEELKDKLDEDFLAIAGTLALRDKDHEREEARAERAALKNITRGTVLPLSPLANNGLPAPAAASSKPAAAAAPAPAPAVALTPKQAKLASDVAFDQMVRELSFDFKAKAADRTKTPEEIAREERDRLELLERARLARMQGDYDSEEERKQRRAKSAFASSSTSAAPSAAKGGDDLDDDYYKEIQPSTGAEPETGKKQKTDSWGNTVEVDSEDDDEEEEGAVADKKADKDGMSRQDRRRIERREQRRLKKMGITSGVSSGTHPSSLLATPPSAHIKEQLKAAAGSDTADIPFVIPAPATYAELAALVKGRNDAAVKLIIDRILTCTHPSLGAENINKLKVFFVVLLEYVGVVASEQKSRSRLDLLCGPLFSIAQTVPEAATSAARDILANIHQQMLAFIAKKLDHPTAKMPGVRKALFYLKLFASLFSVSDFQQVVSTPAQLLLGEWAARYPISTAADLTAVSFAVTLLLLYVQPSKRFVPEAINFLLHAIRLAAAESPADTEATFQFDNKAIMQLLRIDGTDFSAVKSAQPFAARLLDEKSAAASAQFRCDALVLYSKLLGDFVAMYANSDAFPEIFEPFLKPLDTLLALPKLPSYLADALRPPRDAIAKHHASRLASRMPLRRNTEKPAQLRQFNPKFEEKTFVNANTDPDKERAQLKKLKRKLKDETKGAMRELRKDAQFIQMQKEQKRREADQADAAKKNQIASWLSRQQQDLSLADREQSRMKKKLKGK